MKSVRFANLFQSIWLCMPFMLGFALMLTAQQPSPSAESTPTLAQFFQPMVEHYTPKVVPSFEATLALQRRVSTISSLSEIAEGLPFVVLALRHQDATVRMRGAEAIFAIALRPDRAVVIGSTTPVASILLNSADEKLQRTGITTLQMLGPQSAPDAVGLLTSFLGRKDRDASAQAGAFSLLLEEYSDKPGVVTSASDYLSRQLDPDIRELVINGIANSGTQSAFLTEAVLAALHDSNEGVRFTAAQALWRMPLATVFQAEAALQSLADDALEATNVRTAAKQALARLDHGH
jgi:HEAT repeat protein